MVRALLGHDSANVCGSFVHDMRINLENFFDHANEKLAFISAATGREEQVEAFRKFLKIETERLRIRHCFGLSGGEIARGRSYLIDMVVCRACQLADFDLYPEDAESGCAVVALGGYGRRELAPFSDVDLLFLYAGRADGGATIGSETARLLACPLLLE